MSVPPSGETIDPMATEDEILRVGVTCGIGVLSASVIDDRAGLFAGPTAFFTLAGQSGWKASGGSTNGTGLSERLCVKRYGSAPGAVTERFEGGDGFVGEMGHGAIC